MARFFTSALPAIAASLLFAACVDLTQPRVSQGGQVSTDAATGGSGGAVIAGLDAANGGSGGGVSIGGVPAGGTAVGGAGGATTTGGTSGTAAGGAGNVAIDAAAGATATGSAGFDAPPPSDVGGGGSAGIGGTSAVGGTSAIGGKSATGGTSASGGKSATGGASASGGKSATGGASGGTSATGGTSTTGGTVADAGVAPMIISIDFVGGMPPGDSGVTGTVAMAASESAGVKPAKNWNSAANNTGTQSSLVLADGTATSASVTWNSPVTGTETSATWTLSWTDAPGDVRMMNGYLDPRATSPPATVIVSGLASPMSSGYDVYVYCFEDMTWGDTRTSKYTIGSTTHTVTQTEPPLVTSFAGFTPAPEAGAGNYVVFSTTDSKSCQSGGKSAT
ncbi:MAG: hypothetical protein WCG85_19615 [Polyangia bacterium]